MIATGVATDYYPSLDELARLGQEGGSVAISREILADLDTPVSAYLKIRAHGPSFLLESVEGGERIGRYSFISSSPRRVLRVKDGISQFDDGERAPCADPLSAVEAMVRRYGSSQPPAARFEGGALGYLSYEAARSFERTASSIRPAAPRRKRATSRPIRITITSTTTPKMIVG